MNKMARKGNGWLRGIAIVAIVFGAITIKEGGSVLFIDGEARQSAGAYVPFVLWFNFIAGFAYIVGGVGLFMNKRWSGALAIVIAVSTLVIFGFFIFHIYGGGAYETRTVAAMSIRSAIWTMTALIAWKLLPSSRRSSGVELTN